jgi:LPXTG-motif cell wall-anchored protein
MEGISGVYVMLGGFAIIVAIAVFWPFKRKKNVQ